jgi:hypothetical protein
MRRLQSETAAITLGWKAFDGFDVMSTRFASPEILGEWGVTRSALGGGLTL